MGLVTRYSPDDLDDLVRWQQERARSIRIETLPAPPRWVCGVDAQYARDDSVVVAAAVLLDLHSLSIVDTATATGAPCLTYQPGLLGLREAPWLVTAVRRLSRPPDVIMCDGHGIAHPDGCGLACHVGLDLDTPTIGCAKNHLIGDYTDPGLERGAVSPLYVSDRPVGAVLRTRPCVKPVFVSPGHRITTAEAIDLCLSTSTYRIPEPIRAADHLCRKSLRE